MSDANKPKRGPKPARGRGEWSDLIIRHHGNIKQIAAALGVTRNTVMKGIAREGLQAELDLARRGWAMETPDVDARAAAAYPLVDVMTATRDVLGAQLENGERPAVLQWLCFLRGLRSLGVLRPEDHRRAGGVAPVPAWADATAVPLDPGVIAALRAGRVTPDEVIAGYGDEANGAIFEALVMVKPAALLRALVLSSEEFPDFRVTDFCGVLRACYIDVVDGSPKLSRAAYLLRSRA